MKGHLSLTAILAQAGFADIDPTRDDVTVQFHDGRDLPLRGSGLTERCSGRGQAAPGIALIRKS